MAAQLALAGVRAALASPQGKLLVADALLVAGSKIASTQKQQKAAKPKAKKRRARKPRVKQVEVMRAQTGIMQLCAITNPFCDESKGSRWPDGSTAYSVAIPIRWRTQISTDGGGNAAMLFTSNYARSAFDAVWGTFPGVLNWFGKSVGTPTIMNAAEGVRVVSGGCKFVSTLAPMTASGSVTMIELAPNEEEDGPSAGLDLTIQNRATYVTLPLRQDSALYGTFRPQGPEARGFNDYQPSTLANPTFETFDWSQLVYFVTGAPSNTVVGFIDYYLNVEVSFNVVSDMSIFARPAPPMNIELTKASQQMTTTQNFHVGNDATVDDGFMSRAGNFLYSTGSFIKENASAGLEFANNALSIYRGQPRTQFPSTGAQYLGGRGPQLMIMDG